MTPDLSLVICTLNEQDSIGAVLAEVDRTLAHLSVEIIVVDDSDDQATCEAVQAYAPVKAEVRILHRQGERGLASAASAGWAMARGRVLGLMDGDGQHDPQVLVQLMSGLERERADIAVASRYAKGARTGLTGFREALSQSGTWLAKRLTGVNTSDPLAGCFIFTRAWWDEAKERMSPIGYKILLDLVLSGRRRARLFEAPTQLRTRIAGESKLDTRVVADMAAQLVEKRSGGLIPARLVLFGVVGATGVGVNVGLVTAVSAFGAPFWLAQAYAVMAAMTTNFMLNNRLTFRDRRLTGPDFWRGLIAFYIACTGGAVLNEVVGATAHLAGLHASLSGLAGAVAAAAFNYATASQMAWGVRSPLKFFARDGRGHAGKALRARPPGA
jgi:dolichol-phosphate mannosyltransferase